VKAADRSARFEKHRCRLPKLPKNLKVTAASAANTIIIRLSSLIAKNTKHNIFFYFDANHHCDLRNR
jgi:hypothetical protein